MTRGIIASAAGMRASQARLDVLANNLANISTTGFKRDEVAFSDFLERNMSVENRPVGKIGSGPVLAQEMSIDENGPAIPTDNPLDVRLEKPNQFFAVQTPDGIRYTRDGAMHIDSDGSLVNASGYAYLDATERPIQITNGNSANIKIAPNGAVQVDGVEQAVLDVVEGSLTKAGQNLYTGNPQPATDPKLVSGSLEGSNVNAIQTMVEMIELQRNFDASQRAIRTQDELTDELIRSLANR